MRTNRENPAHSLDRWNWADDKQDLLLRIADSARVNLIAMSMGAIRTKVKAVPGPDGSRYRKGPESESWESTGFVETEKPDGFKYGENDENDTECSPARGPGPSHNS